MPDDLLRALRHAYAACISYVDAQIGRLLSALARYGFEDNTAVILWSDHGYKIGEYGRHTKLTNYEIDARIPMMLHVPGMAPARSSALVESVDIFPTLTQLLGLPEPSGLEGTSLLPLIDDPARRWKSAAFHQVPRSQGKEHVMGYGVRTQNHRYVAWVNRKSGTIAAREFYDHTSDPNEWTNVADQPAYHNLVAEHERIRLAGWQAALPSG